MHFFFFFRVDSSVILVACCHVLLGLTLTTHAAQFLVAKCGVCSSELAALMVANTGRWTW